MNLNMIAAAAPLALSLTACGISAKNSSSQLNHVPVKGFNICETEVFIQADPHAKVIASKIIFTPDMTEATIMDYQARAMYLQDEKSIFNEDFRIATETYDLALKAGSSTLEVYTKKPRALAGTIEPESKQQIIFTLNGEREALKCRRSGE